MNRFLFFTLILIGSLSFAQTYSWPPSGGSGNVIPNGTAGGIPYYIDATTLGSTPAGILGQCLISGGSGIPTWGSCLAGGGITSLNSQTGSVQVFSNDTNVIVTSSNNTHSLGWASTLAVSRGGTGAALSPALGNIVYTNASNLVLLAAGTSGQVLTSNGAAAPSWVVPSVTAAITSLNAQTQSTQAFSNDTNVTIVSSAGTHALGWTGTLSLTRGGSGASLSAVAGGSVYSTGSALSILAAGTSGQVLTSGGASAPTWSTPTTGTVTNVTGSGNIASSGGSTPNITFTGVLPIANGGTNNGSLGPVVGGIVYTDASKEVVLSAGTSGQFLQSSGGGAPTWTAAVTAAITSLNAQTGTTQIFSNDTNVTIVSSNNTHALGWTSTLSLAKGGSGSALTAANGAIAYSDASKLVLLPAGTSGQFLSSGGAGAPTWASAITTAITSLNSQIQASQAFSNDTNVTIVSSAGTHALGWTSTLSTARGGSGAALSPAVGDIVYTDASKLVLLAAGTSGQFLKSNGGGAPSWGVPTDTGITSLNSQTGVTQIFANDTNLSITSSNNTHTLGWLSTLSLARGGSGAALTAANGAIAYSSASALVLLPAGTSGQILTSGGAGAPTWGAGATGITSLNAQTGATQIFANDTNVIITSSAGTHTLGWSGTLSVARGGTGHGSFTAGSIPYSNGTILTQDNSNLFWDGTNHRMGIGTTAPTEILAVQGSNPFLSIFNSNDPVTTGKYAILSSSNSFRIYENTAAGGDFSSATNLMWITSAGLVGLGGQNPAVALHIANGTTSNAVVLVDGNGGAGSAAGFRIRTAPGALGAGTFIQYAGIDDGASSERAGILVPNATNNGVIEALSILKSTGNVGIGTTAPAAPLHVVGHYKSSGTAPSVTVNAHAGTGATCTIADATDTAGTVTLTTTAVSPASGEQCKVNFATAYGVAPICTLQPASSNAIVFSVINGNYATSTTAALSINYANADATGHVVVFNYMCIETQ